MNDSADVKRTKFSETKYHQTITNAFYKAPSFLSSKHRHIIQVSAFIATIQPKNIEKDIIKYHKKHTRLR